MKSLELLGEDRTLLSDESLENLVDCQYLALLEGVEPKKKLVVDDEVAEQTEGLELVEVDKESAGQKAHPLDVPDVGPEHVEGHQHPLEAHKGPFSHRGYLVEE